MRKIKYSLAFLLALVAFSACEDEAEKVMIKENITANELSGIGNNLVLTMDNAATVFKTFEWTAPDYGFQASVTYTLEISNTTNFAAKTTVLTVNNSLSGSINVGDMNKKLLDAGYEPDEAKPVYFRVVSSVNPNVTNVVSNTVTATITPYATSFPPIYMCGAATGGWDWTKGVEVRSSAPSVYSTIAYFISGESFRFFAQADWGPTSYNYPWFTTVDSKLANADDGDKNFKVLSASGYYTITTNLKTKTVVMEAVAEPKMFMTGAALGGWNWTTDYVQLTWVSNGIFEATTEFINGESFRFFAQADWGPTSYNYPYFTGGTVSALFQNADDGDKNFKFVGTTGMYKIKLNMLDKIITMTAQ